MASSMEDLAGQLVTWAERIRGTKYLDEIFEAVKEINRKLEYNPIYTSENPLMQKSVENLAMAYTASLTIEDLSRLKLVHQTYKKFTLICGQQKLYNMFLGFHDNNFEISVLTNYATLQNHRLVMQLLGTTDQKEKELFNYGLADIAYENFNQTLGFYDKRSKYFPVCLENYIQIYELKYDQYSFHDSVYEGICNNLGNPFKNVHDLLMILFGKILMVPQTSTFEVVKDVLTNFAWINSNKYHLFRVILETKRDLLLGHDEFDRDLFLQGMCVALKYRNLFSPSRLLLKTLLKLNLWKKELLEKFTGILKDSPEFECRNFLTHWFNLLDSSMVDQLYEKLGLSGNFVALDYPVEKFLTFRSVFGKQFLKHQDLERIDSFVLEHQEIEDVYWKLKVLDILGQNAGRKDLKDEVFHQNQLNFWKFIAKTSVIQDSTFREAALKKIPLVLLSITSRKSPENSKIQEILLFIKNEIFLVGIVSDLYQPVIFNLKLLQILLVQFSRSSMDSGDFFNWDLLNGTIFHQLLSLQNNEFEDVKELAGNLLVKYFLTNQEADVDKIVEETTRSNNFLELIDTKLEEKLKQPDIEEAGNSHFFYKLKLERLKFKKTESDELKKLLDLLEVNYMDFRADPVLAMAQGKNLFQLIDCLSEFFNLCDDFPALDEDQLVQTLLPLRTVLQEIVDDFLEKINICGGNSGPNFDILEESLQKLIQDSAHNPEEPEYFKKQLLLSIWYTFRAASEISGKLARIINKRLDPDNSYYLTFMEFLIEINSDILKRCVHKGAIEAASEALGKIQKIVTAEGARTMLEPTEEDDLVGATTHLLFQKVDEARKIIDPDNCDFRSIRGQILMLHQIVRNDETKTKRFVELVMGKMLDLNDEEKEKSLENARKIKFLRITKPLHIHQLAALVKDSDLLEHMIPHWDNILVATFNAFKEFSDDWPMKNALLQLIGAIIPKIANQKQQFLVPDNLDYEPKQISLFEVRDKLPQSFKVALLDLRSGRDLLSSTYLIVLLEYFSHFEYRDFGMFIYQDVQDLEAAFVGLMNHPNEKIRYLSAKCFAQFLNLKNPEETKKVIAGKVGEIFSTADENLAHSCILFVIFAMKRFESCLQFMKGFDRNELRQEVRKIVRENHQQLLAKECSYYLRSYLLDLLIYLEFDFDDLEVQKFVFCWPAKNNFGFTVFKDKLAKYLRSGCENENAHHDH